MSIFSKLKIRSQDQQEKKQKRQVFLGEDFDSRLEWFKETFNQSIDITFHELTANHTRCGIIFLQAMVDQQLFDDQVLKYIVSPHFAESGRDLIHKILDLQSVSTMCTSILTDMQEAVDNVLDGKVIVFFEGDSRMIAFPLTSFEKRTGSETTNENVIRGPREAFLEDIHTNVTMVRRRIKSPNLKMDQLIIGRYTKTKVIISHLEGVCREDLVEDIKQRIGRIKIDGVLAGSYIEECIDDRPLSPFPQSQKTERPDVAAAALLEGRVVIFVDGDPVPLIAPVNFYMFLQSAEDYYQRYFLTSFIRLLRYGWLIVSLTFPSFYIAITTFHPEMIPTSLLLSVAASRENVPFPSIVEAFLMEIAFEGLREAGIRTPKAVGQAIGILGAIIIGQAAVQAGIVSAIMVIIVSITGIASFVIPGYDLGFTVRLLRFPIMILAGTFGIFGLMIGTILIYIHVVSLRSFGLPYLSPTAPLRTSDLKDTFIRVPWWLMRTRPSFSGSNDGMRSNINKSILEDDED
ncbi:spore germination protein [Neobacillus mesonae]|uniref:spore germination protein n=1 Tax=Neobacillus mesonae TaxID=1193713 RepID=UPI00203B715C|nr:spore germination protein [Neobacillus mesonae]MCM3571174.1 spore germination protein [Neobacillus mesonae]